MRVFEARRGGYRRAMSPSDEHETTAGQATSDGGAPAHDVTDEREALLEEIEETREELGATVEALAKKADVKAQVHEKVEEGKQQLQRKEVELKAKLRGALDGPAVPGAIAAVAGLLLLASLRRRR
jgi:ribosome-binding protein aMBF1 (putative translation factor)